MNTAGTAKAPELQTLAPASHRQLEAAASNQTGRSRRPHFWPTPAHDLLLRAALLPGPEAIAAWEQWRLSASRDPASQRLLPILYHNLRSLGVAANSLQEYRRAYDQAWCENQFMFSHAAAIVRGLREAGIEVLLLKGAALALAFYPDPALRPMSDIDILVRPEQIAKATEVCRRLGWQPIFDPLDLLPLDQGVHFVRGSEFQLDLHWRPFWEFRRDASDDPLWVHAVPLTMGAESTRCLNGTHQLLHVCVHGTQRCDVPLIRWVADAMAVLRSPRQTVDWDELTEQTARRRYTRHMLDTLSYLQQRLDAPIPAEAMVRLRKAPATIFDSLYYRTQSSNNEAIRLLLWWQLLAPLRSDANLSWRQRASSLHRYLRAKWRVRNPLQLPLSAVSRIFHKLF